MARWIVAGLVVLNAILGISVYMHLGGDKTAFGQIGGSARDYVTVAGYSGGDTIIYVLEPSTGRLAALKNGLLEKRVTVVAARNITQDFARAVR